MASLFGLPVVGAEEIPSSALGGIPEYKMPVLGDMSAYIVREPVFHCEIECDDEKAAALKDAFENKTPLRFCGLGGESWMAATALEVRRVNGLNYCKLTAKQEAPASDPGDTSGEDETPEPEWM